MKSILFLFTVMFIFISCNKPDEAVLPLVGVYRTHILGVAGPFDMVLSTDKGTQLLIEAPFDGFEWAVIKVKIHNAENEVKEIRINDQSLDCCNSISGKGFYLDKSIELNYTLKREGKKQNFKIIGVKR